MSERDESTGQFAPAEPLTGKAYLEHEAGYIPMPDEEESPDELTIEDAAEKLSDSNTPESEIVTHIAGADLPDNMSMTVEQASKSLSDARTAEDAEAERLKADQIRKEVDELRGDKPADDQPKETKAENQPADSNDLPIHDDPDIAKALSKPKFVEAIKAYDNQVQQQVTQAVEQANDFARMSFAENFPEISNLPPQQWEGALIAMAQQEPERFKSAINSLNRVSQLQAARQQQQVQQQQREQVEFQHYAKAEDARFAELVKDEPPARLREIEAEIPRMLSELGVDPLEFLKAGNESRFLRTAAAQKVLVDAAKYRLMMQAPKPVAARTPPPRVQRPGASAPRLSVEATDLASLERQLASATGDRQVRLAADIVAKRRGGR